MEYIRAMLAVIVVLIPFISASKVVQLDKYPLSDKVVGPASILSLKDTISKMMARETKEKNVKQGSETPLKRTSDPYVYLGCDDNHIHCASWATSGECTNNPEYMLENCPYSCGLPCITDCYDTDTQCREWANRGECLINPEYMIVNCQESCGACVYFKRDVTRSQGHGSPGTKADSVEKLKNEEKLKRVLNLGKFFNRRETWFRTAGNGGPPGTR